METITNAEVVEHVERVSACARHLRSAEDKVLRLRQERDVAVLRAIEAGASERAVAAAAGVERGLIYHIKKRGEAYGGPQPRRRR